MGRTMPACGLKRLACWCFPVAYRCVRDSRGANSMQGIAVHRIAAQHVARLYGLLLDLFPERHLYVRSGAAMRAYVLTPAKQVMIAGGVAAVALWVGIC